MSNIHETIVSSTLGKNGFCKKKAILDIEAMSIQNRSLKTTCVTILDYSS